MKSKKSYWFVKRPSIAKKLKLIELSAFITELLLDIGGEKYPFFISKINALHSDLLIYLDILRQKCIFIKFYFKIVLSYHLDVSCPSFHKPGRLSWALRLRSSAIYSWIQLSWKRNKQRNYIDCKTLWIISSDEYVIVCLYVWIIDGRAWPVCM